MTYDAQSAQQHCDGLLAAKALIAAPNGFPKRALARTARGGTCHPSDPHATCFCTSGAILRAQRITKPTCVNLHETHLDCFFLHGLGPLNKQTTPQWNDEAQRTQADVVAAFDRAITYFKNIIKGYEK